MRAFSASGLGEFMRFAGLVTLPAVLALPVRGQGYNLWTFNGPSINASLGYSVAAPGDVDGDGHADLAIGAPYVANGALTYAGQVRVYSGATGAILFTISGSAAYIRLGS